jgi:hypothetical protein
LTSFSQHPLGVSTSWSFLDLEFVLGGCAPNVAIVANAWRNDGDCLRWRDIAVEEFGIHRTIGVFYISLPAFQIESLRRFSKVLLPGNLAILGATTMETPSAIGKTPANRYFQTGCVRRK